MSFISKLFGKTEASEPDNAEATLAAAGVSPTPGQAATEEQPQGEPAGTANSAASDDTPDTMPGVEVDTADDTPWWEAAAPADETIEQAVARPVASSPAGTQPLDMDNLERAEARSGGEDGGTRPLTTSDVPALAAQYSQRGLAFGALRDVGRVRSVNQDNLFALVTTLPREGADITLGLFVVADGMGGHHGGEVASRMAVGTVAQHVLSELVAPALADGTTEALQPLIVAAVQEANRAIWEHGQLVGSDMGTTCTVALLLGHALYIGHVGDSRAYLATAGSLQPITDDHSTVGRLIKLGQLDLAEAREHPLRSQLYRTVGQQPEVLVDFVYQQTGDASHLLLCSDGLWSMLDDGVMLDVLEHSSWPQDASRELIARANLAGGEDNISAIVVTLPSSRQ
jgi:serine/threonine protein phosphatase PrpC